MADSWSKVEASFRTYLLVHRKGEATANSYIRSVRLYAKWCGDPVAASDDTVALYISELRHALENNTVAYRLSCLRAFYKFCIEKKLRKDDPTAGMSIKIHKLLPRHPLSSAELAALLDACRNQRDRVMITVTYSCGLRIAELIGLRADDIDLVRGEIIVRGKGGNERLLTPGQDAIKPLAAFLSSPRGVLWWTKNGTPMTVKRAQLNMEHIAKRAGVRAHWHKLRVTFSNDVLDAGVPIEELQIMLGHARLDTTRYYAGHTIRGRAMQSMRRLNLASRLPTDQQNVTRLRRQGTG